MVELVNIFIVGRCSNCEQDVIHIVGVKSKKVLSKNYVVVNDRMICNDCIRKTVEE